MYSMFYRRCFQIVTAAVLAYGLPGGLGVPLLLALCTASWVWTLPETRGVRLMAEFAKT